MDMYFGLWGCYGHIILLDSILGYLFLLLGCYGLMILLDSIVG